MRGGANMRKGSRLRAAGCGWSVGVILLLAGVLASDRATCAPNGALYTVPFGAPTESIEHRRDLIAIFLTCTVRGAETVGEDALATVLAKMYVLYAFGRQGPQHQLCPAEQTNEWPPAADNRTGLPSCQLHSAITVACVRYQINSLLLNYQVIGNPGTDPTVCVWPPWWWVTKGDWDIHVRDLVRIFELNDRLGYIFSDNGQPARMLTDAVRQHIRDKLLDIRGAPGEESYGLGGQCGNQEHQGGSPDDWADGASWLDGALDDIGDALAWLFRRLALLPFAMAAADALPVIQLITGSDVNPFPGATTLLFGRIPESENHRLMIESSRFLINRIMLAEMGPAHPNRANVEKMQDEVRTWLLQRLAAIARDEFSEYNARPYQRYSLAALRNLHDFARDETLITAAQNVLDLAAIKFAIGSSQGRRLVPFRRKMESLPTTISISPADGQNASEHFNGLFDFASLSDSMMAIMLLYTGDTRQAIAGRVSSAGAREMMLAAASGYRPPAFVLDLAIRKPQSYMQRLHHHTVEIYASTPPFVIMAGGVRAGPSSTVEVAGVPAQPGALGPIPLSKDDDQGAAVPTTVMIDLPGFEARSLEDFVRIEGGFDRLSTNHWTFNHNICVYRGFACGFNIVVPDFMLARCGDRHDEVPWLVIKLNSCLAPGVLSASYFLTVYREACDAADAACKTGTGFVEAVAMSGDVTLEAFVADAKARLGAPLQKSTAGTLTRLQGKYRLATGEEIEFDTRAHEHNSGRTGIEAVNGAKVPDIGDWARAEGPLSAGKGSATFTFRSPNDGRGLRIEMDAWAAPKRFGVMP